MSDDLEPDHDATLEDDVDGLVRERRGNPLEGVDLSKLVQAAVTKTVNKIVGEAVETMFTDQMREEVSGLALEAAQSTLQPDDDTPEPESSGDVDVADEPPKETLYASVDEFVRKSLNDLYRRPVGSAQLWAPDWWAYPEALSRLDALWRAWEHLRLDGATGMSVWWKDHVDHHMSVLMSPNGPFGDVLNVRTNPNEPLPYAVPPESLFLPDKYVEPDLTPPADGADVEPVWCQRCGSKVEGASAVCGECNTPL